MTSRTLYLHNLPSAVKEADIRWALSNKKLESIELTQCGNLQQAAIRFQSEADLLECSDLPIKIDGCEYSLFGVSKGFKADAIKIDGSNVDDMLDDYMLLLNDSEKVDWNAPSLPSEESSPPLVPDKPPFECYVHKLSEIIGFVDVACSLQKWRPIGFTMPGINGNAYLTVTFGCREDLADFLDKVKQLELCDKTYRPTLQKCVAPIENEELTEMANKEEMQTCTAASLNTDNGDIYRSPVDVTEISVPAVPSSLDTSAISSVNATDEIVLSKPIVLSEKATDNQMPIQDRTETAKTLEPVLASSAPRNIPAINANEKRNNIANKEEVQKLTAPSEKSDNDNINKSDVDAIQISDPECAPIFPVNKTEEISSSNGNALAKTNSSLPEKTTDNQMPTKDQTETTKTLEPALSSSAPRNIRAINATEVRFYPPFEAFLYNLDKNASICELLADVKITCEDRYSDPDQEGLEWARVQVANRNDLVSLVERCASLTIGSRSVDVSLTALNTMPITPLRSQNFPTQSPSNNVNKKNNNEKNKQNYEKTKKNTKTKFKPQKMQFTPQQQHPFKHCQPPFLQQPFNSQMLPPNCVQQPPPQWLVYLDSKIYMHYLIFHFKFLG